MSKPIRILIIEDSENDALLVVARLEQSGFDPVWKRVETAGALRAALAGQPWDIAFSDHSMRSFDSDDALKVVKASGLDIPFVILSGAIDEDEAVAAMHAGAVDYIRKDNLSRLIPVVERELRAARERRERQQAEAAQRESQARKSAMLDSALDCIVTIDHEGKVFDWNPAAEKMFGYRRAEVIGRELDGLIIPHHLRERYRQGLERYLSTGQGSVLGKRIEMSAQRADATEFPVELSIVRVPTEGPAIFTGFIRDITGRKRAEDALRQSEERFSKAFRASPLGIAISTLTEGRLIDANDAFLKLFGYTREEILGRTSTELGMWADPNDRTQLVRQLLEQKVVYNLENAFRTKSGEVRHSLVSLEIVELSGERCILILFNDITERKHLEEQFRQLQKMESIGQLAAGVAHDFNNLLAVIQGHTDMLLSGMVEGEDAEESLKQVATAATRAASLTRQLLVFSRKQEMQPQDMNLNEAISGVTRMLGRLLGADVAIQFVPTPDLPTIHGDVGMIEQVLLNLAVNARDAMPGGGRLTIAAETRNIDESQTRRNPETRIGAFVCLSVSDTGCGIAPEVLLRIFEPFFTTKEVGKGTGLGLATVYGIVKQHQGWIEVESEVGRGTTFSVFLPASSKRAASTAEPAPSAAVRGRGETILIAEDEPVLRRLAARVLRNLGYEVLEAGSGVEAIEVWEHHGRKVDLLLTDMVMPDGLTGRELAKKLEAHGSSLKIIYTSGYNPEASETGFVFREGINFLQKPCHPQKLAKAVRDCLDKSPPQAR